MERIELQTKLDAKVQETKGIKGFLLKKVWPIIRDLFLDSIIDAVIEFLESKKKR